MSVGDQTDILGRLKAVLPPTWFPVTATGEASATPVLDGVLSGPASALSWAYSLLQYVVTQTRIKTATGVWLDIIAQDYFGTFLSRRASEADGLLRMRILKELLRPKVTRSAVIQTLTDITNYTPIIFEPAYTLDTGGWDVGGWGYDVAGGWGETDLPYQFFVTAYRPASVAGVSAGADGWDGPIGAWDAGAIEYTDPSQFAGPITDAEIYDAVANVIPDGVVAWMQIENHS